MSGGLEDDARQAALAELESGGQTGGAGTENDHRIDLVVLTLASTHRFRISLCSLSGNGAAA